MKTKTSELTGAALDYAVAVCEGIPMRRDPMGYKQGTLAGYWVWDEGVPLMQCRMDLIGSKYSPSTKWEQMGLIITQNLLCIEPDPMYNWAARSYMDTVAYYGETPLIAAARCYVASKLGDVVDIPEELCEQ